MGDATGVTALTALTGLAGLAAALGLGRSSHVAVVGGGGKTTLVHAIARQVSGSSVVTTTTKMGADQHAGLRVLIAPTDEELLAAIGPVPVVVWAGVDGEKALGLAPARCDQLATLVDHVVIEADGSKHQPFKAPAWYEPVVPETATLLVQVMGAAAFGKVILDRCHRPLRVAALAGCQPGERLTPERAVTVLLHPAGALRALPPRARTAVVINQVDDATRGDVEHATAALAAAGVQVITIPRVTSVGVDLPR